MMRGNESPDDVALVGRRGAAAGEIALSGLYEITRLLCAPAELSATLARVAVALEHFIDMNACVIALFDPEGQPERIVGTHSDPASSRAYYLSIPERAIGQIVTHRAPLVLPDVALDRQIGFRGSPAWEVSVGRIGLIGVPITGRDDVLGVMVLDCRAFKTDSPTVDTNIRLLSMVGALIGQTARLHRLVERDRERLMGDLGRRQAHKEAEVPYDRGSPPAPEAAIVGDSPAIVAVIEKIRLVARSNATVLLRGESGTGKEVFARALHQFSPRGAGPFVKLNCAALPESVLESELFGHEKGAFTGALAMRKGRFELAHGGTLFLDEIGEISASFQAKLLRVLQEGEFERVGGTRTLSVDVRVVAATNRNLEDAVTQGRFRADLYYRLSVIPVFLPPLRERPSDIPLLAREFLERFNRENGTAFTIDVTGLEVLSECYFPGNVRELENCIRRTATLSRNPVIGPDDFACHKEGCLSSVFWRKNLTPSAKPSSEQRPTTDLVTLRDFSEPVTACASASTCMVRPEVKSEKEVLIDAMERAGWVQAKAARMLGMTPRQVGYALRKNGIPIRKF